MKCFFKPRIGQYYECGFRGYKTLVLGAHFYCPLPCEHKEACLKDSRPFDRECPCYKDKNDEYFTLSNSCYVEVNSYLEGCPYPSFSMFTKYMMNKRDYIPDPVKYRFWEHVCFYNYLQHYLKDGNTPKYLGNEKLFAEDWDAFQEVLEELQPELIYVWNESIKETILAHEKKLTGRIVYLGETDMQGLTIYRFLYKHKPVEAPEILLENFSRKFQQELSDLPRHTSDAGSTERLVLDLLQLLRFKTRVSGAFAFLSPRVLMRMAVYLYPQVWNRSFSIYLIKRLQEKELKAEGLKDMDRLYTRVSEVIDSKKWERVYSTFYWERLERQILVQSLGMIPPFEWAWYSLVEPHRGFLFTRTPADCLIVYLDKSSDYLGSYLLDLMGYPLSDKSGMLIICHPDDIDSYLNILKNNRTGLKVREVREWEHLLMLVLEKGYEGKGKICLYHKENEVVKLSSLEVETLLPHKHELMPKDRVARGWFKDLVKKICEKEVYYKRKYANPVPLSLFLFNLYKEGLIQCYVGGWIGSGAFKDNDGKEQKMNSYQYAHLHTCFSKEDKEKKRVTLFELSGKQFEKLFHDTNINKPPRDSKSRKASKEQVEKCFNEVWNKTVKMIDKEGNIRDK